MAKYKSKYPLNVQVKVLKEMLDEECYSDLSAIEMVNIDMTAMQVERWIAGYEISGDQWFTESLTTLFKEELEEEVDRRNYNFVHTYREEFFSRMDKYMEEKNGSIGDERK